MREIDRLRAEVATLRNAVGTLLDCIGVLARSHPDTDVKISIGSKLAAFSISETRDFGDKE